MAHWSFSGSIKFCTGNASNAALTCFAASSQETVELSEVEDENSSMAAFLLSTRVTREVLLLLSPSKASQKRIIPPEESVSPSKARTPRGNVYLPGNVDLPPAGAAVLTMPTGNGGNNLPARLTWLDPPLKKLLFITGTDVKDCKAEAALVETFAAASASTTTTASFARGLAAVRCKALRVIIFARIWMLCCTIRVDGSASLPEATSPHRLASSSLTALAAGVAPCESRC